MWERNLMDEMRRMHEEMDTLFSDFFGIDSGMNRTRRPQLGQMPGNKDLALGDADKRTNLGKRAGPRRELLDFQDYREPVADIWDNGNEVVATVELPGVDKKDIDIDVDDDKVEIKVEKSDEQKDEDKDEGTYRYMRSYSGFYRALPLPDNVKGEEAEAKYNNGVLEIKMPKDPEKAKKTRKIDVK